MKKNTENNRGHNAALPDSEQVGFQPVTLGKTNIPTAQDSNLLAPIKKNIDSFDKLETVESSKDIATTYRKFKDLAVIPENIKMYREDMVTNGNRPMHGFLLETPKGGLVITYYGGINGTPPQIDSIHGTTDAKGYIARVIGVVASHALSIYGEAPRVEETTLSKDGIRVLTTIHKKTPFNLGNPDGYQDLEKNFASNVIKKTKKHLKTGLKDKEPGIHIISIEEQLKGSEFVRDFLKH
jgi:hypothetical protein